MTPRSMLCAAVLATLLSPLPAMAQETEHRIGGNTVPADQVEAVQAQCDDLRQGEEASPVAEAAYDEDTNAEAADAAAETAVDLSSELWNDDATEIDVTKLSLELCDEGNFALSAN